MKLFWESVKKFKVVWILVLVLVAVMYLANASRLGREQLVYAQSLDVVVAVVQDEPVTLRDFAVYVAHQEAAVQEQALAYNMNNTRQYWNMRTELGFVSQVARNEALSMAIHDVLFCQLYQELEMEFSEAELTMIQNDADDFWNDLVDEEKDVRLGITQQDVYDTMYQIACAQKAQVIYAGIRAMDYEDLDYASEEFLDFLSDYKYEVRDSVLNRLDFGDITLIHK